MEQVIAIRSMLILNTTLFIRTTNWCPEFERQTIQPTPYELRIRQGH
jgi:hypothetical protein